MGTPLSNQSDGPRRPPAISLRDKGQFVDFAIVNMEKAPAYVYGTNERAMTKAGQPKTKDVLTVVVIQGTGVISENKVDRPFVANEVASIHIEGQTRWSPDEDKVREKGGFKSWSGALEDHGQLEVGDVCRWFFEDEVQGKGAQPRRLRLFKLRRAKPEETERTQLCERLHKEGTAIALTDAPEPDFEPF